LKGKAYAELKKRVYKRDSGMCQKCYRWLPLTESGVFNVFTCAHLCHIKSKGSGGSDTEENTYIGCFKCHIVNGHLKWRGIDNDQL